jgi:hypothetical protein
LALVSFAYFDLISGLYILIFERVCLENQAIFRGVKLNIFCEATTILLVLLVVQGLAWGSGGQINKNCGHIASTTARTEHILPPLPCKKVHSLLQLAFAAEVAQLDVRGVDDVHLKLDVDINDLVALEGGDNGIPGHLGNAHRSAVAVGQDSDGEGSYKPCTNKSSACPCSVIRIDNVPFTPVPFTQCATRASAVGVVVWPMFEWLVTWLGCGAIEHTGSHMGGDMGLVGPIQACQLTYRWD